MEATIVRANGAVLTMLWNASGITLEIIALGQKMGIYEVRGDQYAEALETCEKQYGPKGHRYVGLVSTREPIQRTLSLIHEQ